MNAPWIVERLDKRHDRSAFDCGNAALDHFLTSLAFQYDRRRLGRTYVAVRESETRVFGYYTASSSSLSLENLSITESRRLPRHPVPTVHLGRMAVDRSIQGQGLGTFLLFDFLERAIAIAQSIGVYAIDVRPTDSAAKAFYQKFGFICLANTSEHLYLPIKTLEDILPPDRSK